MHGFVIAVLQHPQPLSVFSSSMTFVFKCANFRILENFSYNNESLLFSSFHELNDKGLDRAVTCKIKHLQKCFRAVDFPRLCHGRRSVVKMFYFTCNHFLSSTCVQNAKTFAKMF